MSYFLNIFIQDRLRMDMRFLGYPVGIYCNAFVTVQILGITHVGR